MKTFVAGIDGGGSKTEALLIELESGRQMTFLSGGINSIVDGLNSAQEQLQLLIKQMKSFLENENGCLLSICLGSASIIKEDADDWSLKTLCDTFPQAKISGVSDSRNALEGALNGLPGVVVVSGTGTIAYSMASDKTMQHCGGWGPVFGDEGSGYSIGSEALRSVAMEMDGRGEATLLTEHLRAHLQFQNEDELLEVVYGQLGRKEIAALANLVGLCAEQNDRVALRIIDDAAKHLATLVLTLIQQNSWDSPPIVSYAGGVFRMGESILRPFRAHLGKWAGSLQDPYHTPSYGAAMLAMKELNHPTIIGQADTDRF